MSCFLFHKWGKWFKPIERNSTRSIINDDNMLNPFIAEVYPVVEVLQHRVCHKCGKYQERILDIRRVT